jgi:hypothetical protein
MVALLLGALASSPPAWSRWLQAPSDPSMLPLVRAGRTLHFRSRSRQTTSQANQAPAPQVAFVLSLLEVVEKDDEGWFTLEESNTLYAADGDSMGRLGSARDQRTRRIRVEPASGRLSPGPQFTRPPEEDSRQSRPLEITRTDDGFGLNAEARTAVGLSSLLLPAGMYAPLAREESVSLTFDFWLVKDDPRKDHTVVPVVTPGEPPPPGADGHVQGTTQLRPRGRETFHLTRRAPAAMDDSSPATDSSPDQRLSLPALAISVHMDLTIQWLPRLDGSVPRGIQRQDRMAWTVLADPGEPWILEADGSVQMEVGEPPGNTSRKASMSRRLDLVSDGLP